MSEGSALGRIDGDAHIMPVRVYWEDTDGLGIVYYANYLRFIERARSDLLRLAGIDQRRMLAEEGLGFVVRRCDIEYLSPARLDDELLVRTVLKELRGASLVLLQSAWRDARELVRANVRVGCLNGAGRPARIPPPVARALATLSPNLSSN
jgi:acyl-CoA thioester hydrolase